ncbi:MAG: DUF4082 domain-containing protein, partial [Solirubrobacterales bacterium]
VMARAVDDSGNLESPGDQVEVEVTEASCPCSIWEEALSGPEDPDPGSIELGVKFRSDVSGLITGIRYFKTVDNTGIHVGHLWTGTGTQLAEATFTGEGASGWQTVTFNTPVPIDAGTTYVASYYAPNGHYASVDRYFSLVGADNGPLHALANEVDGPNGIFQYGASGGLFSNGGPEAFEADNYLVDVVFTTDTGPDTTPPEVSGRTPAPGAAEASIHAPVTATFGEAMDPESVDASSMSLEDGSGNQVAGSVSYSAAQRKAIFEPNAPLSASTTYKAMVKGGAGGVTDLAGNPLAADSTWSFTTAGVSPPPPDEGPGGPVLVIASPENPFSRYYAEILRAEGMNEFIVRNLSAVTPALLDSYDVAILGDEAIGAEEAEMVEDWVVGGGHLIAMRPDPKLNGLLGITPSGGELANAYMKIDTGTAPGAGLVDQTIQFHGSANRYAASGAQVLATLYSDAETATANPAVTLRSVGPNGGEAAAFSYDLARSVVYTRQGNPAWAGEERDGNPPIRSDDLFYGAKAGEAEPDWVNLNKAEIPQADEQQRLLTNLVEKMALSRKPLPRFWFLPRAAKAAIVLTGDDHANGGLAGRFKRYEEDSPPGCVVSEWQCVRATSYMYPSTPITDAEAASFVASGFEIAMHAFTSCSDWTSRAELESLYDEQLQAFATNFPSVPAPSTNRTHCVAWSEWDSQPKIELENGIRLDTNYYYWPGSWIKDRPGMFTGSGMPMRFAEQDGGIVDVYQAATQMTDESEQTYPFTVDTLLDNALGSKGYYGVFTANMHTDAIASAGADAIVASAQERGVPVVSARQMLTWLDGRNQSSFGSIEWSGNALSFTIDRSSGANGLRAMLPVHSAIGPLQAIDSDGTPVSFTTESIKGIEYAFFEAASGNYTATYRDEAAPVISDVQTAAGNDGAATIAWKTNEPADSRVDYGTDPGALTSSASDAALVTSHSLHLTGLEPGTTYSFRVRSADGDSNATTEPDLLLTPQSFSTPPVAPLLSGTVPPSPANQNAPLVVGSATAGTTVRLYAGGDCSGSPLITATAAELEAGIAVSVTDNSTTSIRATAATSGSGASTCSAPVVYVEDSGAPDTEITAKPASLVNVATASFSFTGDDGSGSGIEGFECRIDSAAWTDCPSPQEYGSLAEGSHEFEVRAVDAAGNVDTSPASAAWTVDTTAPDTTITAKPASLVNVATASFSFTGDDGSGSGIEGFECRIDSTDPGDWSSCATGKEYTGLSEGSHTFEVRALDKAANADASPATYAWTVDTTPPAVGIDSGPSGLTNNPTPTFAFHAGEAGAGLECSIDNGTPDFGPCSDTGSHTPSSPLADGPHAFRVRSTDQADNQATATRSFEVDATAPDTSITAKPAILVNSATATFAFSGDDGSGSGIEGFECRIDSTDPGAWGSCANGKEYTGLS